MESFASPTCFFKEQSESLKTLTFKGSISIEQVQKIISVVETSSEQLYLGISDETLMISLNTGALVKPTEENFRQTSLYFLEFFPKNRYFSIFSLIFDQILMKFYRNFADIWKMLKFSECLNFLF